MRNIIYHHPVPFSDNPRSGSQIRPLAMLRAFRELGYNVDVISGYVKDRKHSINVVKNKIKNGVNYDFMYCENTSMPTQLTESHHLPISPNLDFNFFKYIKKQKIPIGLFYRDIYWKFNDDSIKGVTKLKAGIAKLFYNYELYLYNNVLTKMYIPSYEMQEYIPHVNSQIFSSLPPGHNVYNSEITSESKRTDIISFFYVGGLNDYYDLKLLVHVLRDYPKFHLTICTRVEDWESSRSQYQNLPDNVIITHDSGQDLLEHYLKADICVLYFKPIEYRDFAMPIKLFEYIGYRKPILSTKGTLASKLICSYNNGWVVKHDDTSLRAFLDSLSFDDIYKKSDDCEVCAITNTWLSRAEKVAKDLCTYRG